MKLPEHFPFKRIALAVALSILVHSLLLWQLPTFDFSERTELPPLQAKLEPLPRQAIKAARRKTKKPPAPKPQPLAEAAAASAPAISEDLAASAVAADTAMLEAVPGETIKHALPKHAQLTFAVQYGSGTFKLGEVTHRLEIIDGHYTLQAQAQTTGLVSLFKKYALNQISAGLVTRQGLRPDSYVEEKADAGNTQTISAHFDWDAHQVKYSNGKTGRLLDQAQDLLSLPYHLSQQALNVVSIPVVLSYGSNVNQYYIAVGEEITLSTPMGELRAIPLSKVHGANEEGLIMWLALEYRLLPVKILHLDKSGEITVNMIITDIRVSDE